MNEIYSSLSKPPDPSTKPTKRDVVRMSLVGGLTVFILSLLFIITTVKHTLSFNYDHDQRSDLEALINDTINQVTQCESISDYRMGNLIFFAPAVALIFVFSWSVKREKECVDRCDGRPGNYDRSLSQHWCQSGGLLSRPDCTHRTLPNSESIQYSNCLWHPRIRSTEDLRRSSLPNRSTDESRSTVRITRTHCLGHACRVRTRLNFDRTHPVLPYLFRLRYYPILASLQLRNIATRFFACLYIFADIAYTIIREGSCMGFLPLSEKYSAFEDAKIRLVSVRAAPGRTTFVDFC